MSLTNTDNTTLKTVPFNKPGYDIGNYYDLLQWLFGSYWQLAQLSKKDFMKRFCKEYAAQFEGEGLCLDFDFPDFPDDNWEALQVGEKSGFVAPTGQQHFYFEILPNFFFGYLSAEAAGIVITLYTLDYCFEVTRKTRDVEASMKIQIATACLKDYARTLPESDLIFQAIG